MNANSRSIHVRLAVDNSTEVAYINNLGGVRSPLLDSLSRSIWEWCKLRDIFISAQHIPGKVNTQADTLSREISSNLEWSLNGEVFQEIISQTFIPEIDLLASRLNAKTAKFISWHPTSSPGLFCHVQNMSNASALRQAVMSHCYRLVLRLNFVTVELLNDQAGSDFVQCQTKMRAFAFRICSEFKQIELN